MDERYLPVQFEALAQRHWAERWIFEVTDESIGEKF